MPRWMNAAQLLRSVPVTFGRGGFAPIVVVAAVFAIYGTTLGLPLMTSIIFGGVGCTVSLLFHEFGHVRAAWRVPNVRPAGVSIIWAGAATTFEGRYRTGREQTSVAVGGPRASFAFAFSLIAVCFLPSAFAVKEALLLLALFNGALGILNLLPIYPLDGHKVMLGLLWSATGSEKRASRIVRRVGLGWAAIEIPGVLVLFVEKPALGLGAVAMASTLMLQKHFVRRRTA